MFGMSWADTLRIVLMGYISMYIFNNSSSYAGK